MFLWRIKFLCFSQSLCNLLIKLLSQSSVMKNVTLVEWSFFAASMCLWDPAGPGWTGRVQNGLGSWFRSTESTNLTAETSLLVSNLFYACHIKMSNRCSTHMDPIWFPGVALLSPTWVTSWDDSLWSPSFSMDPTLQCWLHDAALCSQITQCCLLLIDWL